MAFALSSKDRSDFNSQRGNDTFCNEQCSLQKRRPTKENQVPSKGPGISGERMGTAREVGRGRNVGCFDRGIGFCEIGNGEPLRGSKQGRDDQSCV